MNKNPAGRRALSLAVSEPPPGSRLSRRKPSYRSLQAPSRREESGPPTKPSIAPPSASPLRVANASMRAASPLAGFERGAPRLTYRLFLAIAGAVLGVAGLGLVGFGGGEGWVGVLWTIAAATTVSCLSMAALITFSFARRLEALAQSAARMAPGLEEPPEESDPHPDGITSLARSLTAMTRRIELLNAELVQCVEEEQARVDELVRERTRELGREAADLRRALGPGRGLLSVDLKGRILGQAPSIVAAWLGPMPPQASLWDYLEHASRGAGDRLERAWGEALHPIDRDLSCLPRDIAVGELQLDLQYEIVADQDGEPSRVLVLLSDVSIPYPDPASSL
jgi:hypothetical protein